jgi:triacylglycerol lipase
MSINWKAKTFNASNAERLGRAADLAYENNATVTKTAKTWEMQLVKSFKHKETQAYLIGDDNTWILAFRGTEAKKFKDWLADLDAILVTGLGGKIHKGFRDSLSYVWTDIWNTLKKDRGSRTLWVTGHSLGGALATLAVAKLRQEKDQPVNGLYTFGSPRVGNGKFADKFDKDFKKYTYRFVNNIDAVTHAPRGDMNFSHVGTLMHFDKNGKLETKKKKTSLLKKIVNRVEDVVTLDDLRDHPMSNYLKDLAKLAKG